MNPSISTWLTALRGESRINRRQRRQNTSCERPTYNRFCPHLELLEDRLPPGSLFNWLNATLFGLPDAIALEPLQSNQDALLGLMSVSGGSGPAAGNSVSGEAFGVSVQVLVAGVPVTLPKTPDVVLPPDGGLAKAEVLNVSVPGVLTSDTLIVMTSGAIGANAASAQSSATVENVNVDNGLVTAGLVVAMSSCTSNGSTATCNAAGSTLIGAQINGIPVDLVPAPNTTITIPGVATVILNEQIPGGDGVHSASLTVNMIHIQLTGTLLTGDIIVSSAHSDVNFTAPPPPQNNLFMTGGGRLGTGREIATFGAHAGNRNGVLSGQVEYIDHAQNINLHSTSIASFGLESGSTNCVTYSGAATVNGGAGYSFTVSHDCDNGEPGVGRDTFRIAITGPGSFSYSSFPRLGDVLTGGNRQLHS